jgi:hypothetical protein
LPHCQVGVDKGLKNVIAANGQVAEAAVALIFDDAEEATDAVPVSGFGEKRLHNRSAQDGTEDGEEGDDVYGQQDGLKSLDYANYVLIPVEVSGRLIKANGSDDILHEALHCAGKLARPDGVGGGQYFRSSSWISLWICASAMPSWLCIPLPK